MIADLLGALEAILAEHNDTYDGEPMSGSKANALRMAMAAVAKARAAPGPAKLLEDKLRLAQAKEIANHSHAETAMRLERLMAEFLKIRDILAAGPGSPQLRIEVVLLLIEKTIKGETA